VHTARGRVRVAYAYMLVQRGGFVFGFEVFLGLTGLMMPCARLSLDKYLNKHKYCETGNRKEVDLGEISGLLKHIVNAVSRKMRKSKWRFTTMRVLFW
jgi:hypothetical protein